MSSEQFSSKLQRIIFHVNSKQSLGIPLSVSLREGLTIFALDNSCRIADLEEHGNNDDEDISEAT